jgi:hypothetical protein
VIRRNPIRPAIRLDRVSADHGYEALRILLKKGLKKLPDGEARIQGGKMKVRALVLDGLPMKEALLTGFIENFERMDLSPYEQADCYKDFVESKGFSYQDRLVSCLACARGNVRPTGRPGPVSGRAAALSPS